MSEQDEETGNFNDALREFVNKKTDVKDHWEPCSSFMDETCTEVVSEAPESPGAAYKLYHWSREVKSSGIPRYFVTLYHIPEEETEDDELGYFMAQAMRDLHLIGSHRTQSLTSAIECCSMAMELTNNIVEWRDA